MNYNHLVLVPCHGIWKGGPSAGDDPNEWFLAPFQLDGKDHLCFKEHLFQGFDIMKNDPSALLIISGGKTKAEIDLSEAQSYYNILKSVYDSKDLGAVELEEFARDSFENVIFSICRFYEITSTYPKKITVTGFEFKRSRFVKNHFQQALGFPLENVKYIGNAPTPPKESEGNYFMELNQSEHEFAVKFFEVDLYGRKGSLQKKKLSRNPFNVSHDYKSSNSVLREALELMEQPNKTDLEVRTALLTVAPWKANYT
ncbi:hypothetical protein PSN45_004476 [Yamadazyma tenuis]|uniref:DUF218 domain-containing protein n=1 Tax=Candida tenuis (strain ATCC 10573 / BCRC 21748 / CBS 615 / JCM 9827 / NBRC 10315 / NRRL Y-1498 / VKM Y-70) TaxID=590646 RepID=G3B5K8_CANTC|nr:uncharacterized protein CANTEDRAFT_107108 [Yamadazyma tenuis ATCC 10573]EGV63253.1 hypothetical protein CANTEDRAFT_107108 [Yamadazyma tenuis ATCC 10573]WEJ96930.1 hypothetical protein PSN45_004476 [Yamadazyma tenuis]